MDGKEKATILIVEDNPLTLRVLIEHLKKLGLKTSVARSGEEALRQLGIAKPDLILLDILLPGIDGFETCRRLKSNVTTKDIPVIFMTALTETADKVKGFEVGGVDYITKPVDFKEVVARVNTRLTIQKLQRRLQARSSFSTSKESERSDEEKATVLIVEDNPMTLQVMLGYLKGLGFQVIGVQTGEDALQRIEDVQPDLILLDVLLPGIDGFETCRRLKHRVATQDTPIIFMTALTEMADKVKAFEAGGVDYITKPQHYAEVVAKVKTHLTLQTLQRQLRKQKEQKEKT
jgi:DNA-binding response OmpR family regulator